MSKNSSFSRFMDVFISYCPRFGCSWAICRAHKTRYMFENYDQKLVVFIFYGRYHELLPKVLGFKGDSQGSKDPIHDQNSSFSCFMDVFMSYCPQFWGSMGIFLARKDTIHFLRVMNKNSSFSRFMGVFMSHGPQFWGSKVICTTRNTRYVFERHNQKLAAFVFYGGFHELLPTVLGFRGNFHGP